MPEQNAIHFELAGRRGDFQLDIKAILPESGVTVIFGRSGCGKTTLLRGLAGLENLSGVIRVGDTTWLDSRAKLMLRPEQRRVGYVFQEAALLPHLSVQGNLDFASKRAPEPHRISIQRAVEWLSLEPLLRRQPAVLSGGERQRVAIARALVSNPRLLLMDEPLASLDAGARDTILRHLEGLTDALAVPMLYVTHSIDEAVRLGDRVLWLDAGRVQALGSPLEVFSRLDLGGLLGEEAGGVVSAAIASHDGQYDLTVLDTVWGQLFVHRLQRPVGAEVRLRLKVRDVSVALDRETRSSLVNVFPALVQQLEEVSPGEMLVQLGCPADSSARLLARITRKSCEQLNLRPGLNLWARLKGVSVR